MCMLAHILSKYCLKNWCFVMCILKQGGDTALNDAAMNGHTEIVEYLSSAGADLNIAGNVSLDYH